MPVAIPTLFSILLLCTFFVLFSVPLQQSLFKIAENFLSPFGRDRLMRGIGELQDISLRDWQMVYNFYFFIFVFGVIWFLKNISQSLGMNFWFIVAGFQIMLAFVFYNIFVAKIPFVGKFTEVGGFSNVAFAVAKEMDPITPNDWQKAMNWMKTNIEEDAVVAAWWHYGSQINLLSGKSTIIDEEAIRYWVHLTARHFFCAQSDMEALEFLKTHHVTHVAMSGWEMAALPTISYIGSDENFDRLASMVSFEQDNGQRMKRSTNVPVRLIPKDKFSFDLSFDGKNFGVGQWRINHIEVVSNDMSLDTQEKVPKVTVSLEIDGEIMSLPLQELYFRGITKTAIGKSVPGLFYLFSYQESNKRLWRGVYFSESTRKALIVRLYALGEANKYFELIYPPEFDRRQYADVKIWQIKYPENVKTHIEYLALQFPDSALRQSWESGKLPSSWTK
jgi:uncharacterized membrane protein YccF (DUF307 family)